MKNSQSPILYHVSFNDYSDGFILKNIDETHYAKYKREINQFWVDELLNKFKPLGSPNRENALFAFDSLANCGAYIDPLKKDREHFFYKVKMKNTVKSPMVLVDYILKMRENHNSLVNIVNEYWNSNLLWNFLEYLSNEMNIVCKISAPNRMTILSGISNYYKDLNIVKKNFPP